MQAKRRPKQSRVAIIFRSIFSILLLFVISLALSLLAYKLFSGDMQKIYITLSVITLLFIYFSRLLWKRKLYQSKIKPQTFDEQTDKLIYDLFTNQELAINTFDDILSKGFTNFRLLSIYGIGGTGKSWLMRVYRYKAQSKGWTVSLVDGSSAKTALEILITIGHDLDKQGIELLFFNEMLAQYNNVLKKVSSETQTRKGAIKLATEIGKQIPVLSAAASIIDLASQDEFQVVLKSFLSKEDINLFINPEKALTEAITRDINSLIASYSIVILFDAYEQMSGLDKWLKSFTSQLSKDVFIVIAGQTPLSEYWHDLRTTTKIIPLEMLRGKDAEKCLDNFSKLYYQKSIPESEKSMILEFSGGLPLAISWAVDLMSRYQVEKFSDVRNETIENLVETMTKVANADMKEVIEAGSVPRWFNEDMLKYILDKNQIENYSLLRSLPFVRSRPEGFALHDRAREYIREKLRIQTSDTYIHLNQRCADFFKKQSDRIYAYQGKSSIEFQKFTIELIYHSIIINESTGFALLQQEVHDALEMSKLNYSSLLIEEAEAQISIPEHRAWLLYWRGELAYLKGDWDFSLTFLNEFQKEVKHGHPAYVNVYITLGKIYYQQGKLEKSRKMYLNSLQYMKESNNPLLEGYVTEQLAKVFRMEGNIEEALKTHEMALSITEKSGDKYQICSASGSYGTTFLISGNLHEGLRYLSISIENSRQDGYLHFACTGLRSRAICLMYLGKLREAEESGSESLQIAESVGDTYNKGFARLALGQIFTAKGHNAHLAKPLLESSIEELTIVGAKFDLGNAWVALGNYYRTQRDWHNSQQALERASELLSSLDYKYGIGWLNYYRAKYLLDFGSELEAMDLFLKSEEISRSINSLYLMSLSLLGLAEVAITQNSTQEAINLLKKAESVASQMEYYDVLAYTHFYMGKLQVAMPGSDIFYPFWNALTNAIKYNCYLYDSIFNEITSFLEVHNKDNTEFSRLLIKLQDEWTVKQSDGTVWKNIETAARINEKVGY